MSASRVAAARRRRRRAGYVAESRKSVRDESRKRVRRRVDPRQAELFDPLEVI